MKHSTAPLLLACCMVLCFSPRGSASALSPMSPDGQPELPRFNHSTVWTGSKLIVWGGRVFRGEQPLIELSGGISLANPGYPSNSGGVYDPAMNTWRPISSVGAPASRAGHSAVWAGDRMIVWGGMGSNGILDDGYAYFPETDEWEEINNDDEERPTPRSGHTAVWSGSEMLVWGGGGRADGSAYDPQTDQWRRISSVDAPAPRYGHGAAWCDAKGMAIWGGSDLFGVVSSSGTGAFYDPATDAWTAIPISGAPTGGDGSSEEEGDRAVQLFWTGHRLIVFVLNNDLLSPGWVPGGLFDPETGQWQSISTAGAPSSRPYFGAWTGEALYVASSSGARFSGCVYDFSRKRWQVTTTGTTGSFRGRQGVWAPMRGEVLISGGRWLTGTGTPFFSGGPAGQRGFRWKIMASLTGAVSFSEAMAERLVAFRQASDVFYDVLPAGSFACRGKVPYRSPMTLDRETPLTISIGDWSSGVLLGDDPAFVPGRSKSARFRLPTGANVSVAFGRTTLTWSVAAKTGRVAKRGEVLDLEDSPLAERLFAGESYFVVAPVDVSVGLGENSTKAEVPAVGSARASTRRVGSGDWAEEYELNSVNVKGQASTTPWE